MVFIALAVLVGSQLAVAQDTRTVTEPVFPAVCTTLKAQLTASATGLSSETLLDTSRIQSAMNACTAGMAVELAPGDNGENAFLIGQITLVKGVTLIIDAGATVYASRNPRDFDVSGKTTCGTVDSSGSGCNPVISGYKADGAGIMGYGAIDGRGGSTLLINGVDSGITWWDLADQARNGGSQNNPRLINLKTTNNFTFYKVTLMNSPMFHIATNSSNNFTVWGVKVIAPYDSRNTDGIDPGYSSNVTITNSYISEGDDNVAVGAGSSPGASNISITNNHLFDGHGVSIGSYTQYGVSNMLVDGISIGGTSANSNATGVRIKSDVSRGGLMQNITYQNICMQNVRYPLQFNPFYTSGATGTLIPQFRNITVKNFRATNGKTTMLQGYDGGTYNGVSDLLGITLSNVQIDGIAKTDLTQAYAEFTLGPDPVNFANLLGGSGTTGVTVTNNITTSAAPYSCPSTAFTPIAGELLPLSSATVTTGASLTLKAQVIVTRENSYEATIGSSPTATSIVMAAPTGTVTIYDNGTAIATGTLTGSGMISNAQILSIPIGKLSVGTHTLTATYGGDSNYTGPIPFASTLTVNVTAGTSTTTTLSASKSTATQGDTVTLAAFVSSTSGTPTGSVTFYDGATVLGSVALNNGQASLNVTSLAVGNNILTATYSGDATFATSTSSAITVTINSPSANISLGISPSGGVGAGQPVTLMAIVSPASGYSAVPTGKVVFYDGASSLGTADLNASGIANLSVSTLTKGSHSISVTYLGDSNYTGANSGAVSYTVSSVATTTTVSSTTSTPVAGQSTTFTATVTPSSTTSLVPTGQVTFNDGTTTVGTGALDASGKATTSLALVGGAHSITAVYAGDTNFDPSTSTAVTVTPTAAVTSLAVTSSKTSTTWGQNITLTATATATGTPLTPTGTVTFTSGSTSLGTASLDSAGKASILTAALPVGADTVTASLTASANFAASSGTTAVTIATAPTTLTVTPSTATPLLGQSITVTAQVAATGLSTIPGGTVTFTNGNTPLGTATLNASGAAVLTTSNLPAGSNTITASYAGSGNYAATSNSTTITVADFSLSANFQSLTINRGGSGTVTLSLAGLSGFSGTVTLACTSTALTCSASPSSVALSGTGSQSATITINAPSNLASTTVAAAALPLAVLLGLALRRRRKAFAMSVVALVALFIGTMAISGCGGSSAKTAPPQQESVTVTATSGTAVHTQTIQVTVN